MGLQVHPEIGRGVERLGQPQGGIGGDRPAAVDDGADAVGRHAEGTGEAVGAQIQRLHEFFQKDFSRVDGIGGAHIKILLLLRIRFSDSRKSPRHRRDRSAIRNRPATDR